MRTTEEKLTLFIEQEGLPRLVYCRLSLDKIPVEECLIHQNGKCNGCDAKSFGLRKKLEGSATELTNSHLPIDEEEIGEEEEAVVRKRKGMRRGDIGVCSVCGERKPIKNLKHMRCKTCDSNVYFETWRDKKRAEESKKLGASVVPPPRREEEKVERRGDKRPSDRAREKRKKVKAVQKGLKTDARLEELIKELSRENKPFEGSQFGNLVNQAIEELQKWKSIKEVVTSS